MIGYGDSDESLFDSKGDICILQYTFILFTNNKNGVLLPSILSWLNNAVNRRKKVWCKIKSHKNLPLLSVESALNIFGLVFKYNIKTKKTIFGGGDMLLILELIYTVWNKFHNKTNYSIFKKHCLKKKGNFIIVLSIKLIIYANQIIAFILFIFPMLIVRRSIAHKIDK